MASWYPDTVTKTLVKSIGRAWNCLSSSLLLFAEITWKMWLFFTLFSLTFDQTASKYIHMEISAQVRWKSFHELLSYFLHTHTHTHFGTLFIYSVVTGVTREPDIAIQILTLSCILYTFAVCLTLRKGFLFLIIYLQKCFLTFSFDIAMCLKFYR